MPGFAGFSAERGRALHLGPHTDGKAETNACAVCHTPTPTATGRHDKTGRDIPPMAVSANPKRFTDPAEVEKVSGVFRPRRVRPAGQRPGAASHQAW